MRNSEPVSWDYSVIFLNAFSVMTPIFSFLTRATFIYLFSNVIGEYKTYQHPKLIAFDAVRVDFSKRRSEEFISSFDAQWDCNVWNFRASPLFRVRVSLVP